MSGDWSISNLNVQSELNGNEFSGAACAGEYVPTNMVQYLVCCCKSDMQTDKSTAHPTHSRLRWFFFSSSHTHTHTHKDAAV